MYFRSLWPLSDCITLQCLYYLFYICLSLLWFLFVICWLSELWCIIFCTSNLRYMLGPPWKQDDLKGFIKINNICWILDALIAPDFLSLTSHWGNDTKHDHLLLCFFPSVKYCDAMGCKYVPKMLSVTSCNTRSYYHLSNHISLLFSPSLSSSPSLSPPPALSASLSLPIFLHISLSHQCLSFSLHSIFYLSPLSLFITVWSMKLL